MKFRAKPREVEVGELAPEALAMPYALTEAEPTFAVLDTSGRTYTVRLTRLRDEFEPADGDAEIWLEGILQRMAEARRPPPVPGFAESVPQEIDFVNRDEDGNVVGRMTMSQRTPKNERSQGKRP